MLNRCTLSASMAMGLLLMTSARTDAADGGGSGGVPLGGGGNDPNPITFIYEVVHGTYGLISKIVDENHKINAAEATRLVWGRLDEVTPLAQGEDLARRFIGSQLVIMEGVNHIPQLEDPTKLNATLLTFLATLPR